MKYIIEAGAHVTILETRTYVVETFDEKAARELAEEQFQKYIDEKYAWADYDEIHTEKLDEYEDLI